MPRISDGSLMFTAPIALALCCGCPGAATGTRVSDVPCLKPTAWEGLGSVFLTRPGPEGSFLLTNEKPSQTTIANGLDEPADDRHGPVYRFDPAPGTFKLVDERFWETGGDPVTNCLSTFGVESDFAISAFALIYGGRTVPVAGDSAVTVRSARVSEVVAVLSADGARPIPFFGSRSFDGQHHHELFSNLDGSRIGSAVRIGVGATTVSPVEICWTFDEEYVIYYELSDSDLDVFNICIVSVGDTLRQAGLKAEPTDQ